MAAKDSYAATRLIRHAIGSTAFRPWLDSFAAPRLEEEQMGLDQNKSFNANWICREAVDVAVMAPADEL